MARRLTRAKATALAVLLLLGPAAGAAQVGNDPAHSPYRDLPRAQGPVFMTGFLGGERGRVGVGHAHGQTFTIGYELPLSGPSMFIGSFTYAATDRFVVDPFKDDSVRKSGPFKDDMALLDLGFRFNLTGLKTWHNAAPYLLGTAGLAVSTGSPTDSSGYRFGKKLTFALGAGTRLYPARRVAVTLDARAMFWRLHYPPDYHRISSPDGIPVIRGDQPLTDWTVHPWFSVGVGWTF
jgi:hypothetical protein